MKKYYKAPGGRAPALYGELLNNESHILIAGATGSGKSVLINSIIARALMEHTPATLQFILIDPKKVELNALRRLPHTLYYADETNTAAAALRAAIGIMEGRYKELQRSGAKKYAGPQIYIIIDEYADLMVTGRKQIEPLITRLIQLGRAAGIHLIIGTQRPTREVISGAIRVNLDCKIALHTATAQDSRNIININGAEALPRYGHAYILNADGLKQQPLPPLDEALPALIQFWTGSKCKL